VAIVVHLYEAALNEMST